MENVKEFFKEFAYLYPQDIIQLASLFKLKRISKGEHFLREGDLNYNVVIVIKGLLAHYTIDNKGDQKILLFVPERGATGALQTTINKKSADENIIALENSLLLKCDIRELEASADKNIRIQKFLNHRYKDVIMQAATRINFLIANSPEERYRQFTNTYPNLESRLKQKDLASFLGITISSLSRMKARISQT